MIIKCFPKNGGYETDEVKTEKLVMYIFGVVGCEIVSEVDKKHPHEEGLIDTVLVVITKDDGAFRFNLNDYHNIYLMSEDGKTVERFKPQY